MDVLAEYNKLKQKKDEAGGFKPLVLQDQMKLYRKANVTTKQYNKKTKKFDWFDQRTGTFFDKSEAKKYIDTEYQASLKKYYLEKFGTETPNKDLKYLKEAVDLEKFKNRKNLSIDRSSSLLHGFRGLISRKVEGSDQKVFDAEHNKEIDKRNQLLIKSKEGTSYEAKDNAQLEYKIDQSVKNQEAEPINLKDVSATSGYVDMRRKQLEIDKQFNTSRDGVVY
jgi:hypothetical protein